MNFFPRHSSLFARLQRSRSLRSLFSQSGIPAAGLPFSARVLYNRPTQYKAYFQWPKAIQVFAWLTGFTLAFAWLGWFFSNAF